MKSSFAFPWGAGSMRRVCSPFKRVVFDHKSRRLIPPELAVSDEEVYCRSPPSMVMNMLPSVSVNSQYSLSTCDKLGEVRGRGKDSERYVPYSSAVELEREVVSFTDGGHRGTAITLKVGIRLPLTSIYNPFITTVNQDSVGGN